MKLLAKRLGSLLTADRTTKRSDTLALPRGRHVSTAKIDEANKRYGVDIEALSGGGYNVWPPKGFRGDDPFEGDHYAQTWREAIEAAKTYAKASNAATSGAAAAGKKGAGDATG